MDKYGKNYSFQPRFWEELEEALNKTTTLHLVIKKDYNGRLLITLDNNKVHYNYGAKRDVPIDQESRLKQV